MKKRILSLLLALALLLTALPQYLTPARAAVISSGSCGKNLTWTLDANGLLTISGTGEMADYENNPPPWYDQRTSIQSVIIENGVTSIGDFAFYGCNILTSASLPDSVTSIGSYSFSLCRSLISIMIPDGVTRIEEESFSSCYSLTSVTIPDSVTSIGNYASLAGRHGRAGPDPCDPADVRRYVSHEHHEGGVRRAECLQACAKAS